MFNKHKIYKHSNMTDVAFLVTDMIAGFPDEYILRGYWLRNTGLGNKMQQIASDSITVKHNDVNNWHILEDQSHE